ncbi:dentin sialophosphoprotein [Bombyx mandarina]|uniref:Dentin sialophosphoprotein n=1 Tax=Bombyx mandarina TaxID=7092 RepID=A0A6J2K3L7_BOMMA|nr:dentin sialophosphoprotein [Bombyx mandarina]
MLIGLRPTFQFPLRRNDIKDNIIEIDDIKTPKSTQSLRRQETQEESQESESSSQTDESSESDTSESTADSRSMPGSNEDNAAEESVEDSGTSDNDEQDSASVSNENDSDYDSDEPPGGDGMGGGILGLLAGLSGGDGDSDLGTLLATVSGIVANLSGDGIDLNSLIASGIGLFAGLLSEGEENPGSIVASYLLTSLDTITGGGAQNNGAFFGKFISKLVKGTSAAGDPDASSEEGDKPLMADSAGFLLSLITSLLGDMSKGSSDGSSS